MKKLTKLSVQWFYELLERGECDIMDFKEQLEDKRIFGHSLKNFGPNYEEMARDVVAFANLKGGFLFVGIADKTKEYNADFRYDEHQMSELIKQVQDRTMPTITIKPHRLMLNEGEVLVLEIPFSPQLHRTSRGEFLIRNHDGNRAIEPYEMATIMAEKGMIVYDQKTWNVGEGWIDNRRLARLRGLIETRNSESPYLDKTDEDLMDSLGMTREDGNRALPTTTGLLFVGNDRALRELPYYEVKYIHYYEDGTYRPYEYKGNIIEVADACFNQLKAEIKQKEYVFGLFREYVEDYSEIVIRELLINALAHRDISRQQIVEIRKYDDGGYLEIESPGTFPDGVNVTNYLRKTNPRNPNIMDILREIGLAEKAGSGFDKIFTDLLKKGKPLPVPEETDTTVTFRIKAEIETEKLIELSLSYENQMQKPLKLDQLLVLREIVRHKKVKLNDLEKLSDVSAYRLHSILLQLEQQELIESNGKTSGTSYLLHVSKRKTVADKVDYVLQKKQDKARQREAILRYIDEIGKINNPEARALLKIASSSQVSKLFKNMMECGDIVVLERRGNNFVYYGRKR